MRKIEILIVAVILLLPAVSAVSCTTASQADCGRSGSVCQHYVWNNNTCVAPSSCPAGTIWSNSTQNCVTCPQADAATCQLCKDYIYSTVKRVCTTCVNTYGPLCKTCDGSKCTACNDGFVLTSDAQACYNNSCTVPNCQACTANSTNFCQTCFSPFVAFSGACVCNIANCAICSSGTCVSCFTGYSVDASKTGCKLNCMANCETCNNSRTCSQCSVGYVYNSASAMCTFNCSSIDANCVSCSTLEYCSSCSSNFTLSANGKTCNPRCSDSNCVTCTTPATCSQCLTGFSLVNNTCSRAICTIQNCLVCATASTCQTCATLFRLNTGSTACQPDCSVSNCAFCSNATACLTCNTGFRQVGGLCTSICTISNCRLCATAAVCQTCNDGFILSANGQACNFNCGISGCITCASTTTCSQCTPGATLSSGGTSCVVSCRPGTYLSGGRCVSCPSNCVNCDTAGKCFACSPFFYINATSFNCAACSTIDSNCFDCSQSGTCTSCKDGFYVDNNVCVSQATCTVANCQACSSGSCVLCAVGFMFDSTGKACTQITCPAGQSLEGSTCTCGAKSYLSGSQCISCSDQNCLACSASICRSCVRGYYPSGTSCVACSSNCVSCTSLGCQQCNDGFFLRSGACASSTSTKSFSVSNTGAVISCPPGCRTCDLDANGAVFCWSANDGFALINGVVYKCAITCLTCAAVLDSTGVPSTCLTCPTGSAWSSGRCTQCSGSNAVTCRNTDATYSLSCTPGYTAVGGVCKACGTACAKCSNAGEGKCDAGGCIDGYVLKPDGCLNCFNGCFSCASDPNVCLQCSKFYFLFTNATAGTATCLPCSSNCVSCTSATVCTSCSSGYYLVNNACITPASIPNCVTFDTATYQTCTACDNNYKLTGNACTVNVACNITANCTSCPYNYFLSTSLCFNCPTLPNCNACHPTNSAACIDCVVGYYVNPGTGCIACSITGCAACSSPTFCTRASDGYFLILDISAANTGKVQECGGLCATCTSSRLNCLSCKSGSSLIGGSQCMSDNNQVTKYTAYLKSLGTNSSTSTSAQAGQMYNSLNGFQGNLQTAFGYSSIQQFKQNVQLLSVKGGSVVMQFVSNTGTGKVDAATAFTNVQDPNIGTLSVATTTNTASSSSSSDVNLGLILGVSIPLGVILIIIILLIKIQGSEEQDEKEQNVQRMVDHTDKDFKKEEDQHVAEI